MGADSSKQVSELLLHWGAGDRKALEAILPFVYNELKRLARYQLQQQRAYHSVELRCFGGLTIEDTSEFLGISPATVKRSWSSARAWFPREMNRGEARP